MVCEALRDALKATRAADFAATAARALASAARASCARRRERRDLAGESDDDEEDDEVGSATQAERDLLECCAAGLAAALARAPAAADVAACIVGVAGPHSRPGGGRGRPAPRAPGLGHLPRGRGGQGRPGGRCPPAARAGLRCCLCGNQPVCRAGTIILHEVIWLDDDAAVLAQERKPPRRRQAVSLDGVEIMIGPWEMRRDI